LPQNALSLQSQYPPDFIQQIQTLFGGESDAFMQALEDAPVTSVRKNPFKPSAAFDAEEDVLWCAGGKYLAQRPEFIFDPLFHAGAYYVQESSSMFLHHALKQLLAQYTSPVRVLDLCAAPGGKSTLVSSLLSINDLLVSNEIIKSRAGVLEENLVKWGQPNVVISNNDPKDFKLLKQFFDIIIIDAPCSGEGLFRRDKGSIEEWSLQHVDLCESRQQRIVSDIIGCLKPGGFLVYSTCTFNTKENETNVKWMQQEWGLKSVKIDIDPSWPIEPSLDHDDSYAYRFLPHKVKGEGLFLACLQKADPEEGGWKYKTEKRKEKLSAKQTEELSSWLTHPESFEFFLVGERAHAIPAQHGYAFNALSQQLYLKNAGVFMGTFAKNELIPSHDLALSNTLSQSVQRLAVTKEEAIRFLRKDTLELHSDLRGWTVLTYENLPLGWVKLLPNRLNNYLPSHLRILKEYKY
jgi:16S rRNA C967 or C1407 C5-methylase (RsmB/RsmF family)/NOL1/NOP2/fmu family ribosome biogenesis protein